MPLCVSLGTLPRPGPLVFIKSTRAGCFCAESISVHQGALADSDRGLIWRERGSEVMDGSQWNEGMGGMESCKWERRTENKHTYIHTLDSGTTPHKASEAILLDPED